ncbi:MAG: acetolactate synthase [Thermomicrobiales bacterium]|nr:acetolactate synthase [Thermomicrobiales bacterium]
MRAGVAAVRVLAERGVRYAFGVPGESFLGLLDALYETPEIALIATRHEGGASFMADAVGKLTGQPAICMGTRGVGSANLAIGVHTAQQDSTPLIAMVGQVETPFRHREALQEVELAEFFGPITKWAVEPPTGAELPRITSEAYRRAVSGRPGPVAIALRGDILDESASDTLPAPTSTPSSMPTADAIDAALDLLMKAKRPLIVAGGGVTRADAAGALAEFAESTGIPVMTAFRRLDAFPVDHRLSLGGLSFGTSPAMRARAKEADVVLAIGTRLAELTTLGYTVPNPDARLIQIDISPDDLGKTFPASVAIVADAKLALDALNAEAGAIDWPDWDSNNRADRDAFLAGSTPPATPATENLVDPAVVVAELQRQLPPEAILTSDAGNFFGWVARYYGFRRPRTFLGPTAGAMGYAVPAAVAAAIVTKSSVPVIALAGDGGFMMTSNELAVAAQLGLRVVNIVFNNGIYGTIRLHQEREYPGRVAGTDIWSPDFGHYARAFGGLGVRVERNADVADAVRQVLAHDGISILDVAVSPETIAVGQFLSRVNPPR